MIFVRARCVGVTLLRLHPGICQRTSKVAIVLLIYALAQIGIHCESFTYGFLPFAAAAWTTFEMNRTDQLLSWRNCEVPAALLLQTCLLRGITGNIEEDHLYADFQKLRAIQLIQHWQHDWQRFHELKQSYYI